MRNDTADRSRPGHAAAAAEATPPEMAAAAAAAAGEEAGEEAGAMGNDAPRGPSPQASASVPGGAGEIEVGSVCRWCRGCRVLLLWSDGVCVRSSPCATREYCTVEVLGRGCIGINNVCGRIHVFFDRDQVARTTLECAALLQHDLNFWKRRTVFACGS